MNLSNIPMAELKHDLNESYAGLVAAQAALALGITKYGNGKNVQDRLDGEQEIIDIIEAEILRRKKNLVNLVWRQSNEMETQAHSSMLDL